MTRVRQLAPWIVRAILGLTASALFGQTGDDLRYKINYQCNGERIEVSYCRHDSDMAGVAPTTPQNDYCLVYYPDRPKRGGFMVQEAELRRDIITKLQACGALPSPQGQASSHNTLQPTSADAYYQQGRKYSDAKQYPQAIEAFNKSIAMRPTSEAYDALGVVYFQTKQFANAVAPFQQAARLDPTNAGYQYNLGGLYYVNHQNDKAIGPLREAIRLKPNYPDALDILGSSYVELAKLDDALKVYRALQKLDQDNANRLYQRIIEADLDAKEKAKPSATKRAEAYRNLDVGTLQAKAAKGDDAAMKRLADTYYAQHDSANGLKWTIAAAERGDAELQNELGWRYQNSTPKDLAQARKWYRKAGEQGLDTAQLNLCESYAAQFALDQGVISGAGKDDPNAPITPIEGNQADIDEAFNWCEKGGDQALYLAQWYIGVLNARGGPGHPPDYAEAYFWLTAGGLKSGAVFLKKVGQHLTDAQRAEIEKRAATFHPEPMELFHDMMNKASGQQN